MRRSCSFAPALILLLIGGCADSQEEDESGLGEAPGAIQNDNALNANALNANALNANALNANALNANALNANALNANSLTAIKDPGRSGELSRALLKYVVKCALGPAQSFEFSWTDDAGVIHDEAYGGELSLAPYWAAGPLDTAGEEWVSACLASRVNWYGVQVTISSRGDVAALDLSPGEAEAYPSREGAFWGNVFTATPALFACHDAANVDNSRKRQRDCAAGHLSSSGDVESCGMIHIVGACSDFCAAPAETGYHPNCSANAADPETLSKRVITTFLP